MQCLFYVYKTCYDLPMEINVFTKNQDSLATKLSSPLAPGKKQPVKMDGQIVRLIFSYGNSGYSIRIFTVFASLIYIYIIIYIYNLSEQIATANY